MCLHKNLAFVCVADDCYVWPGVGFGGNHDSVNWLKEQLCPDVRYRSKKKSMQCSFSCLLEFSRPADICNCKCWHTWSHELTYYATSGFKFSIKPKNNRVRYSVSLTYKVNWFFYRLAQCHFYNIRQSLAAFFVSKLEIRCFSVSWRWFWAQDALVMKICNENIRGIQNTRTS